MSVPDIATQIVKKVSADSSKDIQHARTIVITGSKSVGKTSLIHSFLEKPDKTKETLVLEYSFGRKTSRKQGIEKTICHVWEYGGRLEMLKTVLGSIPVQGGLYYCVVIDLSKIKTIWNTLDLCIQAMKDNFSDLPTSSELIIIGGKYDLFKNYDNEIKKLICLTIRSVAMVYNANVVFYSSQETQLVRRGKDLFYNIGFGNGIPLKEKSVNYTKPLIIPKGADSWESIGIPASSIEQIKSRHVSRITSETEIKRDVERLQRSHPEPILDSLAALKYEELRNMDTFDPSIDDYLFLMH